MQIKTGCELEEVPLNLRPRTPWEIGLYSVSYRSSVYLGPPHNFWATLTADVHISTYLNFSELMYFRCLAPEFEKRKLGSSATKTDQMSSKSMGSWLQTLGRWIKPFSFGFSFQIYLLLRTINSGFCFLCPQGPLGIPIKLDDFRADVSQEIMALNVLSSDKWYLYTHSNLKIMCNSLGYKIYATW